MVVYGRIIYKDVVRKAQKENSDVDQWWRAGNRPFSESGERRPLDTKRSMLPRRSLIRYAAPK